MRFSRSVTRNMGPGGPKCACCFPAPGSKYRKAIFNAGKKRDRKEAFRLEQTQL